MLISELNYRQLLERKAKLSALVAKRLLELRAQKLSYKTSIASITEVTFELRKDIWYRFLYQTEPLIESLERELQELFEKQLTEVLRNVEKHPPERKSGQKLTPDQQRFINLWMFDRRAWENEFAETIETNVSGGVYVGGTNALQQLDTPVTFTTTEREVIRFIEDMKYNVPKQVNDFTNELLKRNFVEALTNGESIADVTRRVENVMQFCTRTRARRIAQTTMIAAVNKGAMEGNRQSGVVWGTQWIGALDERIRPDHERLTVNQTAVPLGKRFPIVNLEYPGDPSGAPEQIINCRCTTKPLTEKPT